MLVLSEVGVRLSSGCEDMSWEAEECPLLEEGTHHCSEDHE
jgi:hypothetical protein